MEHTELSSMGGKARAQALSSEERSDIARQAALARWNGKSDPKAEFEALKLAISKLQEEAHTAFTEMMISTAHIAELKFALDAAKAKHAAQRKVFSKSARALAQSLPHRERSSEEGGLFMTNTFNISTELDGEHFDMVITVPVKIQSIDMMMASCIIADLLPETDLIGDIEIWKNGEKVP